MSLLHETQRVLRAYGMVPKKRLGQNFIVDETVLQKMVSYAHIGRDEVVLEVGPGLGFLTKMLSQICRHVVAVEIDAQVAEVLRTRLRDAGNVTIMQGDVLALDVPPFDKVVSAPPYSISSPLVLWLLERKFECAVLTFQREFVERLVAQPNSGEYGRTTVITYYRADLDLLDPVSKRMFWPMPKVDSVIVRLRRKEASFSLIDERIFLELLRGLFTQKNRKVRNAIEAFINELELPEMAVKELMGTLPFLNRRVRELMPEDFGLIANEIAKRMREEYLL